ncbi:hypothetical protein Tco_0651067 [Tanacetum coccineum]
MKRSSSSTSTSQNLAFLSSENTSSTNEVSTASGDFRIDEVDLEELDLRWQVAMLTALVAQDALGGYDWSNDFEVEPVNYALMVISSLSSSSSSDNEMAPITGNFLTPKADISFAGLDEYAIRKKIIELKITDLNTKTSETVDKVIIKDWNSDDEDDVFEVQTVSPVKTNET